MAGDDSGTSGSSGGGDDTGVTGDGATGDDDAADSSLAQDSWVPEGGGVKDAHVGDAPRPDAPSDAPSDQKATIDAPVIHDAAIDIAACAAICSGCCDATGKCQAGTAVAQCGLKGALCADCSTRVCPLTEFGCCSSTGACGCGVGGVVGCM